MKKIHFFLATAAIALASCANDDYVGGETGGTLGNGYQIGFSAGSSAVTRADKTGADAALLLNNQFKVYGVKQNTASATNYDKVFVDYSVLYNTANATQPDYNAGWYYVGAAGTQTIKYWDYATADYRFVAGSPVAAFTYSLDANGVVTSAAITGFGGRLNSSTTVNADINPVYIADPVVVAKTAYNAPVKFSFKRVQSKVRVGIYEIVPGYSVTAIKFYQPYGSTSTDLITLNSSAAEYFQGTSSNTGTGTVAYTWTPAPSYTFAYDAANVVKGQYWQGGAYASGVTATSAADAVADLYGAETSMDAATGYFAVLPTPSATAATALTLKCDYTLTSEDGSGETINVKGATATIPADYTKWSVNTAYTYLFKITNNTNGTTGTPGADPVGLFPIVFDAVVAEEADVTLGTETTVSTPSITVYQDGDVSGTGIAFKAGEVTINTEIAAEVTIQKLTGAYNPAKSYTAQAYDGVATTVYTAAQTGTATVAAGTYIIKAVAGTSTAYFVLVVA